MNHENRVRLGYSYLQYLQGKEPEYHVTLTYRQPYPDRIAEEAMRTFVRKIVTRLPRRARTEIGGFVCAERHIDVTFDGSYHFHMLLWGLDSAIPDAHVWLWTNAHRAMSELYPRAASHLCDCDLASRTNRSSMCNKRRLSCRGHCMTKRNGVKVQLIDHTPEKAHEYVAGDIYRLDSPDGAQLLDIGPNGVVGQLLN